MHNLSDHLAGLLWTLMLLLLQAVVVGVVFGPGGALSYYLPQSASQWLQHPLLYVWIVTNGVLGWHIPALWHRGYLEPEEASRMFLALGLGGALGFTWGWLYHLQNPASWYAENIPLVRQTIRDSLYHLVVTLTALATLLLLLCTLGTFLGFVRGQRQQRRLLFSLGGGGLCLGVGGLLSPSLPLTWWMVLGVSLAVTCLLLAGANAQTYTLPKLLSVPGPGWKDIDEENDTNTLAPMLFLVATAAPLALLCASGAYELYLVYQLPRSFAQTASTLPLTELATFQAQAYQAYQAALHQARWTSGVAVGLCSLGSGALLVWHQSALRRSFGIYKRAAFVGSVALILWAASLYPYLAKGQSLLHNSHPGTLYNISQSLRTYRKDHTHSQHFDALVGPSRVVVHQGLSYLAFFPLPLIQLGDRGILAHVTPHHLVLGSAWKLKKYVWTMLDSSRPRSRTQNQRSFRTNQKKRSAKESLKQHFRRFLAATQRSMPEGHSPLLVVLHPDTPMRRLFQALSAAKQAGLHQGFVVLGTPQTWQYNELLIPFVSPIRLLPFGWTHHAQANQPLFKFPSGGQPHATTQKKKEGTTKSPKAKSSHRNWKTLTSQTFAACKNQPKRSCVFAPNEQVHAIEWVRWLSLFTKIPNARTPLLWLPDKNEKESSPKP
ncbi:MAG: hypothetical protein EP343_23915 [Deltaproteobacteria bacterium]|nr:MAG: hypothetical protein EP343_23915 [Deltaproteobacteria bacterium]